MEESVNDKTPPPSPGRRKTAANRQKVQKDTKEANEREKLAAEVEQLKSQVEKEKKRRLSQSVAVPTPKRAKPSAAVCRKKLVIIDDLCVHILLTVSLCTDYIITPKLFDSLFVHRLH